MAYIDLGAAPVAGVPAGMTGRAAAYDAEQRFRHVVNLVLAMRGSLQGWVYDAKSAPKAKALAAKVDSLAKRLVSWEQQQIQGIPDMPQQIVTAVAAGLSGASIGLGIMWLVRQARGKHSKLELRGIPMLQKVLSFEKESSALCHTVATFTQDPPTACVALPAPRMPPAKPGILSGLAEPVKWLAIGLGVYYGGRAALQWLQQRDMVAKKDLPEYLKKKVS